LWLKVKGIIQLTPQTTFLLLSYFLFVWFVVKKFKSLMSLTTNHTNHTNKNTFVE